jgi:hypothetical protein
MSRDPAHVRRGLIALWLATAVAGTLVVSLRSTGRGTPFGDFDKAYYRAGQLALDQPAALYDCQNADGLCFVNLPIVALAFVPVAALSRTAAHAVVVLGSLLTLALIVPLLIRLTRAKSPPAQIAIVTLVLLNGPLHYSLRLGNLTHVVLLLMLAALLALRSGRDAACGVLLGACALVKPPLLIFLPYLASRRPWRPAAASMAAALGLAVIVSVWWFGAGLHQAWLAQYVGGPGTKPIGAYNAQSISGVLVRLTTSVHLVDWVGVDMPPWFSVALTFLTSAVVALLVFALWRGGSPWTDSETIADHSMLLCAMLLISPVSWTHYYCFLLIPMAALATQSLSTRPADDAVWLRTVTWLATVFVSLPVALWIPGNPFFGPVVARGLLSHYAAGAALFLCALASTRSSRRFGQARQTEPVWTEVESNYR